MTSKIDHSRLQPRIKVWVSDEELKRRASEALERATRRPKPVKRSKDDLRREAEQAFKDFERK